MATNMLKSSRLNLLLIFSLALLTSCSQNNESESLVQISGKLINWGNASKILSSNSIQADFGLGQDHILETNENGEFEVSFELTEATYYSLGRNKLFLQPGDQLYMEVDYKDPEGGKFEGGGAAIQSYLSGVAFPKAGSYLGGGRFVESPEISAIEDLASRQTAYRGGLLDELEDVSPEFIRLESMRLKLDYLNTLLSFPIYGSFKEYWEYSEDKKGEVLLEASGFLNNVSKDLMQDEYMKHPNFRDMIHSLVDGQLQAVGIFDHLKMTPFMQEYDAMGALVSQLELNGLTEEMKSKTDLFLQTEHSKAYQDMIRLKLDEYQALETGKPAFDVIFKTVDDVPTELSKFRGKLIYVDLWATWCGPCIEELPAFEQLRKDYAGKEITFLPVSIDTDLEAWQKYLKKHELTENELIINRLDLSDYKVITIPRYLLIDKDFQIISVFAPKPSLPETRELIDRYL